MPRARIGFVVETILGHASHFRHLVEAAAADPDVEPVWMPIAGWSEDRWQQLPEWLRGNWTVLAGLRARDSVRAAMRLGRLDALYFHTQVTAMLLPDVLRSVPAVLSLDATPRQIDRLGGGYDHRPSAVPGLETAKSYLHGRLFAAARRLAAWTPWVAGSLTEDYGVPARRIDVVPPGVDTAYLGGAAAPRAGRTGPLRVLFVGGDFERKGGPQLVEALGRLPAGAWTLDVVSYRRADGPPIPGARLIRWLPPRSPEYLEVFAAADVLALPTLADTFGWVLVEAMAAGLPVVATRVAALPDVVTHGATGLLVEPGDVAGLAAALGRLAADRELRLRMGAAARADALKRFDAAANYRRLLGVIKAVGRARVPA